MNEYAFDVKLSAVVRVQANSQAAAVEAMRKALDATTVSELPENIQLTEFSLSGDGGEENADPFEVVRAQDGDTLTRD